MSQEVQPLNRREKLLPWLKRHRLFLDQRLQRSLSLVASDSLDDHHVMEGLLELNTTPLADYDLRLPPPHERKWFTYTRPRCLRLQDASYVALRQHTRNVDEIIKDGKLRDKKIRRMLWEIRHGIEKTDVNTEEYGQLHKEYEGIQRRIEEAERTAPLKIKAEEFGKLLKQGDLLSAINYLAEPIREQILHSLRTASLEEATPVGASGEIWSQAAIECAKRGSRILGTRDYLWSLARFAKTGVTDHGYSVSTFNMLQNLCDIPFETIATRLLLENGEDNFSIGLMINPDADQINVRVISSLGRLFTSDCTEREKCGLLLHRSDAFGIVTDTQIDELQDLLNDVRCEETVLQRFFELNPQFFGFWEWRELFPQLCLGYAGGTTRDRPDFILTDPVRSRSFVIDLKLPRAHILKNQGGQVAPTYAFIQARNQLLRYGQILKDRRTRHELSTKIGAQLFEPQLVVIIGRSRDYDAQFNFKNDPRWTQGVAFYDYDDILRRATDRRQQIKSTLI